MKENGQLFVCSSESVGKGKFALTKTFRELKSGDDVENKDLEVLYFSPDGSLADRLIATGIARRENLKGFDVMIVLNPEDELQF